MKHLRELTSILLILTHSSVFFAQRLIEFRLTETLLTPRERNY